jgi:hypothetical protein
MRAGVAFEKRQGILTMLTARGEFPEAAQGAPAVQGSFDFGTASLREAVPSLRMTKLDDRVESQLVRHLPRRPRKPE